MLVEHFFQRMVGHQFHDDPGIALVVLPHVVQREQIRMLQVQALRDAAEFDIQVAANQLQRDFFAGVAGGVIHFAEAAVADAALDGVALQGP